MEESISYIMSTLLKEMRQYYDLAFRKFNLTRYEWLVIALLGRSKGKINQSDIKSHIGIDTSYLTKVLDKLVAKNFIVREVDATDKRNRIIRFSDNPPAAIKEINDIMFRFGYEVVIDGFKEDEYKQVINGLLKIKDNVRKHTSELRQQLLDE